MTTEAQTTFRGMDPSPAVEARIAEHVEKLHRYVDRIHRCHVTVEAPHKHQHKGILYSIRIVLTVPGKEIVITHERPNDPAHEDVYVALRDAFNAAARRLEDHTRIRRGKVKHHDGPLLGTVTKLFPIEGYGFFETPGALEVYFHENSVPGGAFSALEIGSMVRYVLADGEGEHGPQASTVEPLA